MADWSAILRGLERAGLDLAPGGLGPSSQIDVHVDGSWHRSGQRLSVLARNAAGDEFCRWRYPGLQGEAPVVFLGDGQPEVVADSVQDFFLLVAAERQWDLGSWGHAQTDPKIDLALASLRHELTGSSGPLQVDPSEMLRTAWGRHPSLVSTFSGHEPEAEAFLPWWEQAAELKQSVPLAEAGDYAAAVALAEPKLHEASPSGVIAHIATWAARGGDHARAWRLFCRAKGHHDAARGQRAAMGYPEEAAAEVLATLHDPDRWEHELRPLLDELASYVDADEHLLQALAIERIRRPWARHLEVGEMNPRRRLEWAQEVRCLVAPWRLGLAELALLEADAALQLGRPEACLAVLEGHDDIPDVTERLASLRASAHTHQAPEASDPLAALFSAWRTGDDDDRDEAAAELALALAASGRRAEAWAPCWEALNALSSSHPSSASIFELAEALENEGLAE